MRRQRYSVLNGIVSSKHGGVTLYIDLQVSVCNECQKQDEKVSKVNRKRISVLGKKLGYREIKEGH